MILQLGSPRSGSTWLMHLLSDHPAIVTVNEPLIGRYLGQFMCDLPGADAAELDTSNFTLRRLQRDKASQFFSEAYSDVWLPALRSMMIERFHAQGARDGASIPAARRLILIKEPNGSESADVIMRALPRARLLFLLRDGRDVVDSELAANLAGSWVSREFPGLPGVVESNRMAYVTQSAYKWLWRTSTVQEAYASHPGPKLIVRYEDLLVDPRHWVTTIFTWLGLDNAPAVVEATVRRHSFDAMAQDLTAGRTGSREFFRSASPGSWRKNLAPAEQAKLNEILGEKLHELGYEAGTHAPAEASPTASASE